MSAYTYLGDRLTRSGLKGKPCTAVRRPDGRCVRGRMGTMLVRFEGNCLHNVVARRLRKLSPSAAAKLHLNVPPSDDTKAQIAEILAQYELGAAE